MQTKPVQLIIAVSGASGALYGAHFLRSLCVLAQGSSSLIVSGAGLRVYCDELSSTVKTPDKYLEEVLKDIPIKDRKHSFTLHDASDIGAKPASGSAQYDGMAIVPCSMKTLASIAHGLTSNLIERAADVCLKERRRLVVVPRETPYNLNHLKNMTALTQAGGIVLPASPGFYQMPQTIDDLGRFIAGRLLSLFHIPHNLFRPWEGDSL